MSHLKCMYFEAKLIKIAKCMIIFVKKKFKDILPKFMLWYGVTGY